VRARNVAISVVVLLVYFNYSHYIASALKLIKNASFCARGLFLSTMHFIWFSEQTIFISLCTVNHSVFVRVRVTLRLAVYRPSFRLSDKPLETHDQSFYFPTENLSYSPYVTSSLTRGRVCHLQLLLVLASAVILRSESRGNYDHILLSQFRDSPNLEGQVLVFISTRNRVARIYSLALGSLFVALYNSQGYGGCIRPLRPRIHTVVSVCNGDAVFCRRL
jgi:hypothetical protein